MEAQLAAVVAVVVVHKIGLRTLGAHAADIRSRKARRAGVGTLASSPSSAPTTAALAQPVVILWLETRRHASAAVVAEQPGVGTSQGGEHAVLLTAFLQPPCEAAGRGVKVLHVANRRA